MYYAIVNDYEKIKRTSTYTIALIILFYPDKIIIFTSVRRFRQFFSQYLSKYDTCFNNNHYRIYTNKMTPRCKQNKICYRNITTDIIVQNFSFLINLETAFEIPRKKRNLF